MTAHLQGAQERIDLKQVSFALPDARRGENLALKRAVMKARREIDELAA